MKITKTAKNSPMKQATRDHSKIDENFHAFFNNEWFVVIFFVTCLFIVCMTAAYIGVVPTRIFGHDTFFLLDNSWRVVNGQKTHVDYASAWGPLSFIIVAAGMKLSNLTADGIGYGSALFAVLIGTWSFSLGKSRLYPPYRFFFSMFLVGLVVAPYALSFGVTNTTHAMLYNRYGYALLGLILLESIQFPQKLSESDSEWWCGCSTGAAVALTLFLKVSYFLAALLLIVAISVICKHLSRRRLLGCALGFSVISIGFLAYLNFDIYAIFWDLQNAAAARSGSLTYGVFAEKFISNTHYLAAIIIFCIACSPLSDRQWGKMRKYQLPALGVVIFAADIFLLFTNQQWFELPLTALFIPIIGNARALHKVCHSSLEQLGAKGTRNLVFLVGAALVVPMAVAQYSALIYGAALKANPPEINSLVKFSKPWLESILLYEGENPDSNGRQYTTYINNGVALLSAVTTEKETVLTIDMFNPFPYAMGRRPPLGGIAAAAYRYTLNETFRPSDDRFFGNADIVMVPKKPSNNNSYFYGFKRIYEPGLHARYYLSAESDWWFLYRRKV